MGRWSKCQLEKYQAVINGENTGKFIRAPGQKLRPQHKVGRLMPVDIGQRNNNLWYDSQMSEQTSSRAAILPYPGDPSLLNYWLMFFDKFWGDEVDHLYIVFNSPIEKPVREYIRK